MKSPRFLSVLLLLTLAPGAPTLADAVLDLTLARQNREALESQPMRVLVREGRSLVQIPRKQGELGLLFDQGRDAFSLVDHRHRTVMVMDEPGVIQFTDQSTQMLSMVRGFSEQLALLPPKQRAKLASLIGDGPLAQLATRNAKTPAITGKQTLRQAGSKKVGGVPCRRLEMVNNGTKLAEFCLADARALPLAEQDYATLEAMRRLAQRLAQRAAPLAQQLGLPVPPLEDGRLAGLPVEMKNLAGGRRETVTLTQIASEAVEPRALEIPADYKPKPLAAWNF